jgi:hypothetical protein
MDETDSLLRERVANFKAATAADLYSAADIVDFGGAEAAVDAHAAEIAALSGLEAHFDVKNLSAALLSHPRLYELLCSLLSITGSIELEDGRRLPHPRLPPKDHETAAAVATVLLELGLPKLVGGIDVRRLLLLVQVASDASRRRFRVEARIKTRIHAAVARALDLANAKGGVQIALGSTASLPTNARRIAEFLLTVDGRPRIAIATTFQTHSGGRQTREMSSLYPSLQSTLLANGISLVLIADGQGMRSLSDRVLIELFRAVPNTFALVQAESGELARALAKLAAGELEIGVDAAGVRSLIATALDQQTQAKADSLPVPGSVARLALATYASSHGDLDLSLSTDGSSLAWTRAELVTLFRRSRVSFVPSDVVAGTMNLFAASGVVSINADRGFAASVATLADDPVFAEPFLLGARSGTANADMLRDFARASLQAVPTSRVAVLLVSEPIGSSSVQRELQDVQAFLPVTVVVIDAITCVAMAQSREPARERLRAILLEQSDLTKLSPFVVRGVTPAKVFFGREEEEATLLSTLSTNSVALLGGRRIGKTSLMRHCFGRLRSANLRPHFGDCQVVRTWADFGVMAQRNWEVVLPKEFKPQHLFDLVEQLSSGSDSPVVFLLDEIDQLLDWDSSHSEDEVPEAFFRACRSISQQRLAQFVFSGERTIANRIWDASSPHWNFCRPLMLRQLTRGAAESLVAEPLQGLGVRLEKRDDVLAACWDRTDGHPELLQFIGDKLVGCVNARSRADVFVSPDDVLEVTAQFEYAEQYLETYWGQATALERVVSIVLLGGPQSVESITLELLKSGIGVEGARVQSAFRMLELYGIARQCSTGYELRALWFRTALEFYGGPDASAKRYIKGITT